MGTTPYDMLLGFVQKLLLLFAISSAGVLSQDYATFDQCGGDITVEKGIIKSPNYPKTPEERTKYENDLRCLWTVDLDDENTLFMVKFWDLVTENRVNPNTNETTCYDYVNITTESLEQKQYCGWSAPEDIYRGVGPDMTILFYSDSLRTYRGFMASFQALPDHDPCREDPCVNGECSVAEDRVMYECTCQPGFTGFICNIDIDECASEPCKNDGRCEQNPDIGYTCFCAKGWQGTNCEVVRKPDPCESNPCRNGGTCTASADNEQFTCECVAGYKGVTCRVDIDECESDPCENGGVCEDGINMYECTCEMPYYGDHCENKQKINGCLEGPCSENGDCISTDDEGGFRCECLPGWTGRLCEEDLQECESEPCQNGGICDDTKEFAKFDCTCVRGYTGRLCQIAPPMCKNPGIPYVEDDVQWEEGSTLRFYCIEGYILKGPENLTCLKNESWSTVMPECIVEGNSTAVAEGGQISPWLGTMIFLSTMLAITLVAFVTWIMLKGPWNFGPGLTRIKTFSQVSLTSYDPHKQC